MADFDVMFNILSWVMATQSCDHLGTQSTTIGMIKDSHHSLAQ